MVCTRQNLATNASTLNNKLITSNFKYLQVINETSDAFGCLRNSLTVYSQTIPRQHLSSASSTYKCLNVERVCKTRQLTSPTTTVLRAAKAATTKATTPRSSRSPPSTRESLNTDEEQPPSPCFTRNTCSIPCEGDTLRPRGPGQQTGGAARAKANDELWTQHITNTDDQIRQYTHPPQTSLLQSRLV